MSMPPPPPPGDQPYPPGQPGYGTPSYGQPGFGAPPPGYAPYGQQPPPQGTSGLAIAGFVVSLVGLVPCFWFWIMQIPGYVGTALSIAGMKATANNARRGRGFAIAGLVIGIIGILLALAITAFIYTSDECIVDGLQIECNFD